MTSARDARLRWFGPIGLFMFGNLFFRSSFWLTSETTALVQSTLVGLCAGWIFWQLNRWAIGEIQERLPGLERTRKRLFMWLLLTPLIVNAAVFSRYGLHILLGSRPAWWLGTVDYLNSFGIQLFYHGVYFSIYEGWYILDQWRHIQREKEELIKIQWQTRFNSLKSQVNPHFLFNSLNALSALIEESPVQASQFVDELSSMYRYLLQANERELVLLSTELTFIESYAHLLQTRHGDGLSIRAQVPQNYLAHSIPPLTLQLLVENAVKHNVVLASRPLLIEIDTTQNGHLRVRNNLQRKNARNASNGVGLANISAKYRMLTQTEIEIREEEEYFTVLLPLLP
ncbi:sensor histidine kinase [Spirosoma aerolatum]|uniref:sensor histidine kinase n=1 Tax=Spirosoma aerolatum TaxID=1211326 RepID=UPI0009AE80A2|nr:histidine kinase [Spirosoma aerolatum]